LAEDELVVYTYGFPYIDQTQFMPLCTGVLSEDQARIVINLTLSNRKRFLSRCGLRTCIADQANEMQEELNKVELFWNDIILYGMINYHHRKKAADIFTRIMRAVTRSIETDLTFHQYYHSETGKPSGSINTLTSLVPIGLFLYILGVTIINSTKVKILGSNPFPWPVTIRYQGLTIVHQEKKTLIIFSDGRNITVDNKQAQTISLDKLK